MKRLDTPRCGRFARIGSFVLAAGLIAATGACKKERERVDSEIDRMGEKHHERKAEHEADRALREEDKAATQEEKAQRDADRAAGREASIEQGFERDRHVRTETLRASLFVMATQPMLIASVASAKPITDRSMTDLNDKLNAFQAKLDEANTSIQTLHSADEAGFKDRDKEATKLVDDARKARDEAWKALDDADLVEPS